MTAVLIIVGIVVLLAIFLMVLYNGLVKLRNRIENAWAQIDVQLKRRYDLIPNLVETVKGYASHERETLDAVVRARQAAMSATGPAQQAQANNMITDALKSIFALAEAYPDLKANTQFLDLQRQLADTENQLAFARQYYNDAVTKLNSMTQTVPWMFLTGMAGVSKREFYKAPEGQQAPPTVDFGTGPSAPGAPAAPGQLPAPAPYTGSDAPITQPNQAPANPLDP